jgi:flavin-dependent dehydrogenase
MRGEPSPQAGPLRSAGDDASVLDIEGGTAGDSDPSAADVCDVLIVGAGPAGSSAAIRLARRGWRVALLERSRFEAVRIGESLTPGVQGELRALGAWSEFLALGPLPCWGTRGLWGDEQPHSHTHIASPYGCGWQVDRRAFDESLSRVAARAGVRVLLGQTLRASHWHGGSWQLRVGVSADVARANAAGPDHTLTARVLIDATGRVASIGRVRGARRLQFDRLVGVATCWAQPRSDQGGHLLVEAAREGWWYSARLPSGARPFPGESTIALLMTDADLCARGRQNQPDGWHAALRATHATLARLLGARCVGAPRVHCAHSQRMQRSDRIDPRPHPWLAVGDAALAVDPLSGSGVLRALRMGRAGADTAEHILERPHVTREALAAYEAARDDECTAYLVERAQHYASERRFDAPFWARRSVGHHSTRHAPDPVGLAAVGSVA